MIKNKDNNVKKKRKKKSDSQQTAKNYKCQSDSAAR